jgi:hypothetical protein
LLFRPPVAAAPSLTLATSSSNVSLAWPRTIPAVLQMTTSLSSSNWQAVSNAILTDATASMVTRSATGNGFFRLLLLE